MKLWAKGDGSGAQVPPSVEAFLAGDDPWLDLRLAPYDLKASGAHAEMLGAIGVLSADEVQLLKTGLDSLAVAHERGELQLTAADEDIHTLIERRLTESLGEVGKKIHTGRSRNDQVLVALRLHAREAGSRIGDAMEALRDAIQARVDADGDQELPGYTHMQQAMPNTVAQWLGAYLAALHDDRALLDAVLGIQDQNPLGSAAGYGSPMPLDRDHTTRALGFARVQENPIYCQNSRGKFEASLVFACANLGSTLNRLASDLMLYTTAEFAFFSLPPELTTGSSIMPQKRNSDVLELVRARTASLPGLVVQLQSMVHNLPSAYNRDYQELKAPYFRAVDQIEGCLEVMVHVIAGVRLNPAAIQARTDPSIHATHAAFDLVRGGMSFRDAYREIGRRLAEGRPLRDP